VKTITHDPVQRAADVASPLFHRILTELDLGPEGTERFMRQVASLYLQGRSDGAAEFAHQLNRTLADENIAAAVLVEDGPVDEPTAARVLVF
jgi:hypothetical protein